MMNDTL
jgi:catechol 2,3-dioxygenase-like lactoylglutathione lyase family enzyme